MKQSNTIVLILIIASVIGFIGGVAGEFFGRYYIANLPVFSDLRLPTQSQLGQKDVIIQEAKKVVVEQDMRISQVIDTASQAVFNVYRKKTLGTDVINSFYGVKDQVAHAIAVTSDGWLVSSFSQNFLPEGVVIVQGNRILDVEEIVDDPISDIKFIKVKAINLPVIEFASSENIVSGQSLLIYNAIDRSVVVPYLEDISYRDVNTRFDLVRQFENYDQRMLISNEVGQELQGAPVLNFNGEIVGISEGGNSVIKTSYINFILKSLLRHGSIEFPYLGINYIPIVDAKGLDVDVEGIMITRNASGVVVNRDSVLFDVLKEGDIITEVENIRLTDDSDFSDFIFDYKMGNEITFKVLRGEDTIDVKYTLQVRNQ